MRLMALLALLAVPAAAATSGGVPLQALTEADVGADALKNAACYAHDGPSVLLVATNRNAVVNSDGDLLLLRRADDGQPPHDGAKYVANRFQLIVSPSDGAAREPDGRTNRPARIRVVKKGAEGSIEARWSCGPGKTA